MVISRNKFIKKINKGFTIVELIVVIVVIAILASITLVSYGGITKQAVESSLQSDLANASTKLKMYQVVNGSYPTSLTGPDADRNYCPSPLIQTDNRYCFKASPGNELLNYTNTASDLFTLDAKHIVSSVTYGTTNDSAPVPKEVVVVPVDPVPHIIIGAQTWMDKNLNVGARIDSGPNAQTDNSIIEKYCYDNNTANCDTYGALYTWNEAMQYSTTEGSQGICPDNYHIPTDAQWKTLEMTLGMTQEQADGLSWRGTDQGTKIKIGGSSGFNAPLGGRADDWGTFANIDWYTSFWSSTETSLGSPFAWYRMVNDADSNIGRNWIEGDANGAKANSWPVRCLKD